MTDNVTYIKYEMDYALRVARDFLNGHTQGYCGLNNDGNAVYDNEHVKRVVRVLEEAMKLCQRD